MRFMKKFYTENVGKEYKSITAIVAIAVVLVILLAAAFGYYTDYLEIREIGEEYTTVFWTDLLVKSTVRAISFVIVFLIFFINTTIIEKTVSDRGGPFVELIRKPWAKLLISLVFSFLASTFISEAIYDRYLFFANAKNFDLTDPIFGKDVGYYVFTRPFLDAVLGSFDSIWLLSIVFCLAFYALIYTVNGLMNFEKLSYEKPVWMHNLVNIAIFFIVKAFTYGFKSQEILYSSIGDVAGAGYTDIYVWFNFYKAAPYILVAIVLITAFFLIRSKLKNALITVVAYPVVFAVVTVVAMFVQNIIVAPNEAVKERPYFAHNMEFTKLAYNLNDVMSMEFPADESLTKDALLENKDTINNVRIVDFNSTLTATNQLQSIRNYYTFKDLDMTKYNINGSPTLVTLAARELNTDALDDKAKTYANKVFRYTHGFGAVISPVNKVTEGGQPEYLLKDIPPVANEGVPNLAEPRIYYGETDADYVIVNSALGELDYSEGSEDIEYSYKGKGGINLNFKNRLLYSINKTDFRMLISQYITKDSKILLNTNVVERVKKAVPFLKWDTDPYLIVDDNGYLKWIIDGYTTSEYYPYSQEYDGINYIRNSVKAVVDAYDGTVDMYVMDKGDPIIKSYMSIYPGVFKEEYLPDAISQHIIYPEYLFKLQAQVYGKYHVTNPDTFYNNSDLWVFAKEKYSTDTKNIDPYYNLTSTRGFGDGQELIVMIPYTLSNKENMVAWFAASCEYESYGKFVAYHFPKNKNIYGTMQIESRIDNDPSISKEMTLWGQGGSNVIRGNMLVVPVADSLLYIEPIYISSHSEGAIPELKRVAVAYGNKIVMEPTLEKALEVLFNGETATGPVTEIGDDVSEQNTDEQTDSTDINAVIDAVIGAYDLAKSSNASGDWKSFGENMSALDKAIENLKKYKQ